MTRAKAEKPARAVEARSDGDLRKAQPQRLDDCARSVFQLMTRMNAGYCAIETDEPAFLFVAVSGKEAIRRLKRAVEEAEVGEPKPGPLKRKRKA